MGSTVARSHRASFAGLGRLAIASEAMGDPRDETLAAPAAPLSLTTSDGTGLQLVALKARAAIEGPLALTDALPAGAAIGRLAMKLAWGWREVCASRSSSSRPPFAGQRRMRAVQGLR